MAKSMSPESIRSLRYVGVLFLARANGDRLVYFSVLQLCYLFFWMLDLSIRQQQWETKGLQGFWDPLRDVVILVVTVIGWGLKSTSIMPLLLCLFTNKWFKYLNGSMFLQRLRLFWLSKYVKLSVSNPGHDKFDQWGWKSRNVVEMLKGKGMDVAAFLRILIHWVDSICVMAHLCIYIWFIFVVWKSICQPKHQLNTNHKGEPFPIFLFDKELIKIFHQPMNMIMAHQPTPVTYPPASRNKGLIRP